MAPELQLHRLTEDETKDLAVSVLRELTDDQMVEVVCTVIGSDSDVAEELIANLEEI